MDTRKPFLFVVVIALIAISYLLFEALTANREHRREIERVAQLQDELREQREQAKAEAARIKAKEDSLLSEAERMAQMREEAARKAESEKERILREIKDRQARERKQLEEMAQKAEISLDLIDGEHLAAEQEAIRVQALREGEMARARQELEAAQAALAEVRSTRAAAIAQAREEARTEAIREIEERQARARATAAAIEPARPEPKPVEQEVTRFIYPANHKRANHYQIGIQLRAKDEETEQGN